MTLPDTYAMLIPHSEFGWIYGVAKPEPMPSDEGHQVWVWLADDILDVGCNFSLSASRLITLEKWISTIRELVLRQAQKMHEERRGR